MGAGVYGPSRLVRAHQRSRPGAPGQLFKARLREESGTQTRGAPRAPGKGPIAERARGLRRQAQGDPWHTKRKKARSVASGLPRAAGWLRSARGPAYLCALRARAWQVCQLPALWPAPGCSRSDSPAGSAPGAAPTRPPAPTHCKMLQQRPGKETPARAPPTRAPSSRLPGGGLSRPLGSHSSR